MKMIETKLSAMTVSKEDIISYKYLRSQIGKSDDNFATFAIELPNKTMVVFRVAEIINLFKGAGIPCWKI